VRHHEPTGFEQEVSRMFQALTKLWHDEKGLTTVEYALLLVLIVLAGVTGWQSLGHSVANRVSAVANIINTAS
jgi:Flp pilus assembly pilin Flp